MFGRRTPSPRPMPQEVLEWQLAVRRFTMQERNGAPHPGVAPLVMARRPGAGLGVVSHSIICGVLPSPDRLHDATKEFRALYESRIAQGSRDVYDAGIAYLKGYYERVDAFDPESITTLLPSDLPLVEALRATPECALVFYVFDLTDSSEVGRLRCLHLDTVAEVLEDGPVFDNVWWHNTLFHGPADGTVVVHFRHVETFDTRFGRLERVTR